MKKWQKIAALASAAAIMASGFAGCGAKKDYDLYIFNTKGENADAMTAAATAYQEETGVRVKTFSLGSGTDSSETLRAEMNSKNKPSIFCIMNSQELKEWEGGGFARDLSDAQTDAFKTLANDIPQDLRLSSDGTNSYGIPFNVEGYGYVVDTNMLKDVFGDSEKVLEAIKAATYDEWAATVAALESYIKDGTAASVTLNGESFDMAATKAGKAANLKGVFAVAGSEKWTYGDHMINVAVNAVFPTPLQASTATKDQVAALKGPITAYAKALDLKTSKATVARGPEFINGTTNGYDASVEQFASGQAIFLKQGNWVYGNFAKTSNPGIVDTLTFVPVKMPFTDADIVAEGRTVESINTSIPVFVPNYYAINAKVSKEEQKLAEDFLVWMNTSEAGQKFVIEDMAFIPYNADPATTQVPNSLGNSIIEYMKDGKTISNPYASAPAGWSGDVVGLYIMENYLTKETWDDAVYEDIANYAVDQWTQLAGLK